MALLWAPKLASSYTHHGVWGGSGCAPGEKLFWPHSTSLSLSPRPLFGWSLGQPLPVAASKRGSLESLGSRGSAHTHCAGQSLEREAKREQGCSSELLQQASEAGQSKSRKQANAQDHGLLHTRTPKEALHNSGPTSCFINMKNYLAGNDCSKICGWIPGSQLELHQHRHRAFIPSLGLFQTVSSQQKVNCIENKSQ